MLILKFNFTMKLAILISGGSLKKKSGIVNIAFSRGDRLGMYPDVDIHYFFLKAERRKFRLKSILEGEFLCTKEDVDGRIVTVITRIEYYTTIRGLRSFFKNYYIKKRRRLADWEWHKDAAGYFKGYDAISAHFNDGAIIAESARKKYGIPYFVTWHGSDIHSIPFNDNEAKQKTIEAIENADCNFFVSNALLKTSDILTSKGRKEVLFNSIEDVFYKYDIIKEIQLKSEFNIHNEKIVTFAGNLLPVKNADLLPDLFCEIKKLYKGEVKFWIIGQGYQKDSIENKLINTDLDCFLWGFQPANKMPDFFNCTDVLVLPSNNEGFPLVTLEALSCGANVVGSNVGGIPEAIGKDFCVDLGDDFIEQFARKVVFLLEKPTIQSFPEHCSWEKIVQKEYEIYKTTLIKNY